MENYFVNSNAIKNKTIILNNIILRNFDITKKNLVNLET